MYTLTKAQEFNSKCYLGEGLFADKNNLFWVDIEKKSIFCNGKVLHKNLPFIPTVVFDYQEPNLTLGTDIGIMEFSIKTSKYKFISESLKHKNILYRSNDGGIFQDKTLLGFMHKYSPDIDPGYILCFSKNSVAKIDNEIKIPNGFIPIDNRSILINDSHSGKIWKFTVSEDGFSKKLWHDCGKNFSPDGGCMVENHIFICMWGSSSIFVFDLEANKICDLSLEVEFPTNCKFIKNKKLIAVTSANFRENMNNNNRNGNSFIFKLSKL